MKGEKSVHDSRIGAEPFVHCETWDILVKIMTNKIWIMDEKQQQTKQGRGPPGTQAPPGQVPGDTAKEKTSHFFFCERLSASMARSLHLSFICIPQSTRALDQGGVEPRQAVSPKALRPWTIPLRYSVGWQRKKPAKPQHDPIFNSWTTNTRLPHAVTCCSRLKMAKFYKLMHVWNSTPVLSLIREHGLPRMPQACPHSGISFVHQSYISAE